MAMTSEIDPGVLVETTEQGQGPGCDGSLPWSFALRILYSNRETFVGTLTTIVEFQLCTLMVRNTT